MDYAEGTECPVCAMRFRDPRVLPCGHSVCLSCLEQIALKAAERDEEEDRTSSPDDKQTTKKKKIPTTPTLQETSENAPASPVALKQKTSTSAEGESSVVVDADRASLACPICRFVVPLTERGVQGITVNYTLKSLLEQPVPSPACAKNAPLLCNDCIEGEQEEATSRCDKCRILLCAHHTNNHRRSRQTHNHPLLDIESARRMGPAACKSGRAMCPQHEEEQIKHYCRSCHKPICFSCVITQHPPSPQHVLVDLPVEYNERKSQIEALIEARMELEKKLGEALAGIDDADIRSEQAAAERNTSLEQLIEGLKKELDERKWYLIDESNQLREAEAHQLRQQKRRLEEDLRDYTRARLELAKTLNESTEVELAKIKPDHLEAQRQEVAAATAADHVPAVNHEPEENNEVQYEVTDVTLQAIGLLGKDDARTWLKQRLAVQGLTGDGTEEYTQANAYSSGQGGVALDKDKAEDLYREAIAKGHAGARRALAQAMEGKGGLTLGRDHVFKLYRKAANQGDRVSQYNVGLCYLEGRGVERDPVMAIMWFRKAASQNFHRALVSLGDAYMDGVGVRKDEKRALELYQGAIKQNSAKALYRMGKAQELGRGGLVKDLTLATTFYRQSAEKGYSTAQYLMGKAYETGRGVDKDPKLALEWYRKAAERGSDDARKKLAALLASA